ncbi:cupin domain-containing protein [Reichenbachiella carrageenanivorans]|uniref:Cupin domain-containing protein n=1 Tax=Reichenbachiella carrageenanivorans TaxID=2979869 RepID=A0ABY6D3C8_9BACT|nr:cupin domain-containing protein [Reichenbachiella carrageenanivorans]UXX80657.1 cupin domain-containing protein [Reichenbachiella carrageenanivorans]
MKPSAQYWIDHLRLLPHPEGGYFKETYRAETEVSLPQFAGIRQVSTGIYFLLTQGNFSAFHRIQSDEMWHFYAGNSLSIFVIYPNGVLSEIRLGLDVENGEVPQAVVPAKCWFASRVHEQGDYALVGCTVSPGFDFADFEMADRQALAESYPSHSTLITTLTHS